MSTLFICLFLETRFHVATVGLKLTMKTLNSLSFYELELQACANMSNLCGTSDET